jgi:uncharacterized protein YydD (DUF2326 family)
MIHSISANHRSFIPIQFERGLNVITAERTRHSSKKDSRNGVGKSTLIEILHFCLGADPKRGRSIFVSELSEWAFTLEVTVGRGRVFATRAIGDPKKVWIDGNAEGWPVDALLDVDSNKEYVDVEDWKKVLAHFWYALPKDFEEKYHPSFRSLVSYAVRRSIDAYSDPFRHFRVQAPWDVQVNIAYLLGLAWEPASRRQAIKDSEEALDGLTRALKQGLLDGVGLNLGELETERVRLETECQVAQAELSAFRVVETYEQIQQEADVLTQRLHELSNRVASDKRKLKFYEEAMKSERPPDQEAFEQLYREAGLLFSETTVATIEAAREFHINLVAGRRVFLEQEATELRHRIVAGRERLEDLSRARAMLMRVLETSGSLDEFSQLQRRMTESAEALATAERRIRELKSISQKKTELKAQKAQIESEILQSYEDRHGQRDQAVRLFAENTQALYQTSGRLVIDASDKGYRFSIEIAREGSTGIERMKTFCFDMTVSQLLAIGHRGPGFIVHDSIIFDGVDARQRALALERAAALSEKAGFQYIVTINSDMVPRSDFSKEYKFDQYVRRRLSDKGLEGRLLGVEFVPAMTSADEAE